MVSKTTVASSILASPAIENLKVAYATFLYGIIDIQGCDIDGKNSI